MACHEAIESHGVGADVAFAHNWPGDPTECSVQSKLRHGSDVAKRASFKIESAGNHSFHDCVLRVQ